MRTLLTFYALDANMNDYKNIFDIDYFNNNIEEYFEWIYKEHLWNDKNINEPTYKLLLNKEQFIEFKNKYDEQHKQEKPIDYKEEYEKVINSKTFKLGDMILKIPRKIKNIIKK